MWDAKNKTVSGCYENAFIARQNKSIKTDELPAEHSDTKNVRTRVIVIYQTSSLKAFYIKFLNRFAKIFEMLQGGLQ